MLVLCTVAYPEGEQGLCFSFRPSTILTAFLLNLIISLLLIWLYPPYIGSTSEMFFHQIYITPCPSANLHEHAEKNKIPSLYFDTCGQRSACGTARSAQYEIAIEIETHSSAPIRIYYIITLYTPRL